MIACLLNYGATLEKTSIQINVLFTLQHFMYVESTDFVENQTQYYTLSFIHGLIFRIDVRTQMKSST